MTEPAEIRIIPGGPGLYDNALFAGLAREDIDSIVQSLQPVVLDSGQTLFREGDRGSELYLLLSGLIQIYATRGADDVTISTLAPGAYFGELALLGQDIRSASVRAIERCVLLPVDGERFASIVERYPVVSTNIGRRLVEQLVTTTKSMVHSERGELVLVVVNRLHELRHFIDYLCEATATLGGSGLAVLAPRICLSNSVSLTAAVRSNRPPDEVDGVQAVRPTYFGYRSGSLLEVSALRDALAAMTDYFRRWWKRTVIFISEQEQSWYEVALPRVDRVFIIAPPEEMQWWQPETFLAEAAGPLAARVEAVPMIERTRDRRDASQRVARAGYATPTVFIPEHRALESLTAGGFERAHLSDMSSVRQRDVLRLARALAKTRVGVSLGAGGARGMAHIGALRYLEERGVPIDAVAGTSIGAMVGASAAKGDSSNQAEAFMHHWMQTSYKKLMRPALSRSAILSGKVIADTCRELFHDLHFEDIDIPLAVVAADIAAGRGAVLRTGTIAPSVHASMAIPGMFPPVLIGPHVLVDGGVCDPVPSGVLPLLGADIRIVVNISFTAEDLEGWIAEEGGEAPPRSIREGKTPNMIDTYFAAFSLAVAERATSASALADVYIRPRFLVTSWKEFAQGPDHMRRGYEAAKAAEAQLVEHLPWLP